ncbi:MAG: hypothetical protein BAJATHORv1_80049 [Candidatus Thorarchaeota archaeon]|nr:MAG: hypothetical protein BAJATHORv1_80049 [Candidatus Thorarchaeota archaeon]
MKATKRLRSGCDAVKSTRTTKIRKYSDESVHEERDIIVNEQIVEIRTSERQLGVLRTSPGLEEYLALGFILSMGHWPLSNHYPEVIRQDDYVLVILDEASIEDHIRDIDDIFPLESDLILTIDDIQEQLDYILEKQTIYQKTSGTFSALLVDTIEYKKYFAEDINQYAAIDKVIGMGLANGIQFPASYLLITGPMPRDIVERCIWVEIPLLGSSSVASDKGIQAAETFNITLLGSIQSGSFSMYNQGAVRIGE